MEEPLDKKAGHIPGAINRFWKHLIGQGNLWKNEPELREQLAPLTKALDEGREVIVYCGSGVSATPNVMALHLLGYPQAKLYAGSWSDWVSYEENPVATGERNKEDISSCSLQMKDCTKHSGSFRLTERAAFIN